MWRRFVVLGAGALWLWAGSARAGDPPVFLLYLSSDPTCAVPSEIQAAIDAFDGNRPVIAPTSVMAGGTLSAHLCFVNGNPSPAAPSDPATVCTKDLAVPGDESCTELLSLEANGGLTIDEFVPDTATGCESFPDFSADPTAFPTDSVNVLCSDNSGRVSGRIAQVVLSATADDGIFELQTGEQREADLLREFLPNVLLAAADSDCGNGSLTAPEQCDDGNRVSGDGCSNICMLESFVSATGTPNGSNVNLGIDNVPLTASTNGLGTTQEAIGGLSIVIQEEPLLPNADATFVPPDRVTFVGQITTQPSGGGLSFSSGQACVEGASCDPGRPQVCATGRATCDPTDPFSVVCECICVGDVDGDGVTGAPDFVILQGNFGSPGGPTEGDLTGDGIVGAGDFGILSGDFGCTPLP